MNMIKAEGIQLAIDELQTTADSVSRNKSIIIQQIITNLEYIKQNLLSDKGAIDVTNHGIHSFHYPVAIT